MKPMNTTDRPENIPEMEDSALAFSSRIASLGTRIATAVRQEIEFAPKWWSGLSTFRKWGPLVLVPLYWAALLALGGFRSDHVTIGLLILVLCYTARPGQALFRFLWPILLTGILYDSMRF